MELKIMRDEHEKLPRLANVSIDLDSIECYHRIHGIPAHADPVAMYTVALPRILDFLDELHIRATFFAVGKDLEHARAAEALREAVARGHEVASHSYSHAYNLRTWSKLSVAEEIEKSSLAILQAVGVRPSGFRTPGYNVDTRILQLLSERGYKYDSSVLPSLPYYLSKGAVMTAMSLFGRSSGSSAVAIHSLKAPTQPYRPSRWAFWKAGNRKHSLPIWEIPIGVVRGSGIPVIGTTVSMMPEKLLKPLYSSFRRGQTTLQFELHGIDFLDANDTVISSNLAKKQPDLRRDWLKKSANISAFIRMIQSDYRLVTLDELADELESAAGPTVVA